MMKVKVSLNILLVLGFMTCQDVTGTFKNNSSHDTLTEPGYLGDANTRFNRGGGGTGSSSNTNWQFTSNAARSRIVETKYGKVQGLSVTLFSNLHYTGSRNFPLKNKIVEIFFGIPYAAPPVKSHRFSPTQTPIPWNDVKPTIQPSMVCPQIFPDIRNESAALKEMPKGYLEYLRRVEPYLRNQSEDCLYLNIFSPIGPDAKPKPVLVYIHGGMFAWGSGNLVDGTVLSAYSDVVFVTINYRLNILGFLNLNDSPSSKPRVANYGLMDIIGALHWIKENIRNFGGDGDNIGLMGYESGAACVNFLMSSPTVTPGLFHRAILISGSSHAPWALISDPSVAGMNIAQALNCTYNNNGSSQSSSSSSPSSNNIPHQDPVTTTTSSPHHFDPVMECLKTKHFSEFTKFSLPKFSVEFGPSVDGIVIKPNFRGGLSSSAQTMGKRDVLSKKYEILLGLSSLERLTEFSEMDLEFGFESLRRDAVLRTLVRNSYRYHRNEILATITNEYIDWERTAQHPISTRDMVVNAVTDALALAPLVAVTDSNLIKKSFFYVFEHSTKDGLYNYHRAGAGGGEELNYMFGYPLVDQAMGQVLPFLPTPLPSNYSKGEMALSELWMSFISNFAHSGNPNGPIKIDSVSSWPVSKERNRYKNSAWEGYDRLHQKYLEIGANKIRTRSHYRAHQMAIWLRLVPELQRSGAQMASTFHNRMKGGNDPALYAGRLKQPEEEADDGGPPPSESSMNSAMLYDLLLGYGYGEGRGGGPLSGGDSILDPDGVGVVQGEDGGLLMDNEVVDGKIVGKSPSLTMTTCYSPVSSSVQSGGNNIRGSGSSTNVSNSSSFNLLDPQYFPPYSVILAITIAIGCSLLILNISIFALCYFRRDKRRRRAQSQAQLLKSSSSGGGVISTTATSSPHGGESDEERHHNPLHHRHHLLVNQYSSTGSSPQEEPPELIKSSGAPRSTLLRNSNSQTHLQAEMEALEVLELTVKQHQQELLGEKALMGMEHPRDSYYPSSSPSMTSRSTSTQQSLMIQPGTHAGPTATGTGTLPRCNGNVRGVSSFLPSSCEGSSNNSTSTGTITTTSKPNPPPRGGGGGVTLVGTLRRGKRVEYSDNTYSDSNNENEELKV